MTLIRRNRGDGDWNLFPELESFQDEMDRLFDFSFSRRPGSRSLESAWAPAVDIQDGKESILVKADLPGLNKDEIEVTVEGDTLILKGEKKREEKVEKENYVRSERYYGAFYREIPLPSGVDANQVKAVYKNGVLELTLPKKEEVKPKQISVEVR